MNAAESYVYQIYGKQFLSPCPLFAPRSIGNQQLPSERPIEIVRSQETEKPSRSRPTRIRLYPKRNAIVSSGVEDHRAWFVGGKILLRFGREISPQSQLNLIKHVLPLISSLESGCLFHASAFAIDGKGVLLLGVSGSGKSTLATLAEMQGAVHLADDVALVRVVDGECMIIPSGSGRMLFAEVLDNLESKYKPLPSNERHLMERKVWIPERRVAQVSGYALSRIVFLVPDSGDLSPPKERALRLLISSSISATDFAKYQASRLLPLFGHMLKSSCISFISPTSTLDEMKQITDQILT